MRGSSPLCRRLHGRAPSLPRGTSGRSASGRAGTFVHQNIIVFLTPTPTQMPEPTVHRRVSRCLRGYGVRETAFWPRQTVNMHASVTPSGRHRRASGSGKNVARRTVPSVTRGNPSATQTAGRLALADLVPNCQSDRACPRCRGRCSRRMEKTVSARRPGDGKSLRLLRFGEPGLLAVIQPSAFSADSLGWLSTTTRARVEPSPMRLTSVRCT